MALRKIPQVDEVWAYREKPNTPGTPVVRAEVLQHGPDRSPRRVRVRWLEGEYPGLDEWVNLSRLIAPWHEIEAVLTDEAAQARLAVAVEDYDEMAVEAAQFVLDVVPPAGPAQVRLGYYRTAGMTIIENPDQLEDVTTADLLTAPHSYLDRKGTYYGPWHIAIAIAERLCQKDPARVLREVARYERADHDAAIAGIHTSLDSSTSWPADPGRADEQLEQDALQFTLVRKWCGEQHQQRFDHIAELRGEIVRLQQVVKRAADLLQRSGHPRLASQVLKQLQRPSPNAR